MYITTYISLKGSNLWINEDFSSKRYLTHIFVKIEILILGEKALNYLPLCMIWKGFVNYKLLKMNLE